MMSGTEFAWRAPRIGVLGSGRRDTIADVAGVTVGHATMDAGDRQTGVTVLRPHAGDLFLDRVPAAVTVINGFGKSVGLVQVQELGVIETPIALTNTFSVGAIASAQIREAIARHPEIGRAWATVNPLVMECNDGYLNDIQAMALDDTDYAAALGSASECVVQGSVGAGRGMSCCQLKGGIGSASRVAHWDDGAHHVVGGLVLANFGRLAQLTVAGKRVGGLLAERLQARSQAVPASAPDKGSIIMLLATDAPLDARQLGRLSRRAGAGLARTGSFYGHGSGDIVLAFSTAATIPFAAERPMPSQAVMHESRLDALFEAAAETIEQSVIHALWAADTVRGRDGHIRHAVRELWPDWAVTLASGG